MRSILVSSPPVFAFALINQAERREANIKPTYFSISAFHRRKLTTEPRLQTTLIRSVPRFQETKNKKISHLIRALDKTPAQAPLLMSCSAQAPLRPTLRSSKGLTCSRHHFCVSTMRPVCSISTGLSHFCAGTRPRMASQLSRRRT